VAHNGDGWGIGGMPEPRPLYSLPELANTERVYVTEGEPAADAARSIGLTATTCPHGSKSADKADWSPLAGKEAILLRDNDQAGRTPEAADAASITAGVRLSRWFGHEARRVYAMLDESDEARERRRLGELIRRKGGSVTPRDLMR
jgi:hypothetical protein